MTTTATNDTMTVRQVNDRLYNDVCRDTLAAISDETLSPQFEQSPDIKKILRGVDNILLTTDIHDTVHRSIYNRIRALLIPVASKTATRIRVFNDIVETAITVLGLNADQFEVAFNTHCPLTTIDHVPDWYILGKATHKLIVGINQLNLNGSSNHIHRAATYIEHGLDGHDDVLVKYLCVLANHERSSGKGRVPDLLAIGFKHTTICFVNQLRDVIIAYFAPSVVQAIC